MIRKKFLTTGEFAELCGTTKETLFHYDRLGLLKPKFVSANGYRRYLPQQFFEYDLIWVLRDAGSSLKDIKSYLEIRDVGRFLSIMEEKRGQLLDQQRRLALRLANLEHILKVTRSALTGGYGEISFEYHPPQHLLATALNLKKGEDLSWDDTAGHLSRHFALCEQYGLAVIFPVGSVISKSGLMKRVYTPSHFFSAMDRRISGSPSLLKSRGLYAEMLFKGSYERLDEALSGLIDETARRGYKIKSSAYIYTLLSYLSSADEENEVYRLAVKVEKL